MVYRDKSIGLMVLPLCGILILAAPLVQAQGQASPDPAAPGLASVEEKAWLGVWEGAIGGTDGASPFPISVRICPGCVLVDMPLQDLYGYPASGRALSADRIAFSLGGGAGALVFRGDLGERDGRPAISGTVDQGGSLAPFNLLYSLIQPDPAKAILLELPGVVLRGTLELPEPDGGKPPVVVLVGSPGAGDRDGNNYNVPGRNDALAQLARALRDMGVASLRYDKRGAGECASLGEGVLFDDHVRDLAAIVDLLRRDGRFSSVTLFGHADGGLICALASVISRPDALVAACEGGSSIAEQLRASVAALPAEERGPYETLLALLEEGKTDPESPAAEAPILRPDFQPYLASWMRYDPKKAFAALDDLRTALVFGEADMQLTLDDFKALAASAPEASLYTIPSMSHALKTVGPDVEENFASFSDPSFPISAPLAELLARFAAGGL